MSARAPATRRFFGPVAQSMIGTLSSAQRMRVPAASSPAIQARRRGTVSASSAVGTGLSPSVRTALSPRPTPRTTRPGWRSASVACALAVTAGWRVSGFVTPLPTSIRSVAARAWVM